MSDRQWCDADEHGTGCVPPCPAAPSDESHEQALPRRPVIRLDCEPCAVCQSYTDGEHSIAPGLNAKLACGHAASDAANHSRPCARVWCREHVALDVNPETGTIRLHPGFELGTMTDTCALDVADRGGITLEQTGAILGVTRERVRQLEAMGFRAIKAYKRRLGQ